MHLTLDHVTVCGSDLDRLRRAFAAIGLASDYGGPHSNRLTHMASIAFDDGSYLELIAPLVPPPPAAHRMISAWLPFMFANAGASAWAISVRDIHSEAERLRALGVPVRGPEPGGRQRPDGTQLQWDTALLGAGPAGSLLPFLIEDRTDRSLRVQPSPNAHNAGFLGIVGVLLAVRNLASAAMQFQTAFDWSAPLFENHPDLGARLAHFPATPVILAEPFPDPSPAAQSLRARLDQLGEAPVAFILNTAPANLRANLPFSQTTLCFGQSIRWLDPNALAGARIGLTTTATP